MASFSTCSSYLAELGDLSNNYISGPYPEFFGKFFPKADENFAAISSGAIVESEVGPAGACLLQPDLLGDACEWLIRVLKGQVPGQRWSWIPHDLAIEKPWTTGDNFVMIPHMSAEKDWHKVGAICHAANETETYQAALVHLCSMASNVFQTQNMRFFVHGILLFESTVEFWVFDRSGMYSSEALNSVADIAQIVSIVFAFKLMTPGALGVSEMLKEDKIMGLHLFLAPGDALYLQEKPIVARDGLFDDGLCCYCARKSDEARWTRVVKFKWRDVFKRKEEEIFKTIQKKHVPGVVQLLHDAKIVDTGQLRAGLRHQPCRRLLQDGSDLGTGQGLEKYSQKIDAPFRNRTCMCLVFSPIGQPLSTFNDKVELLSVLRDAVQTHRMLLQMANVLHRDISDEEILISETTRKGVLIDFDVAMDLSQDTPTGNSITGTRAFMAAGLMNKDPHTYRHDLESFFYVLLQVIVRNKGELASDSRFRRWRVDDWDMARDARIEDMASENLELLLDEWNDDYADCKELARCLWRLLFRDQKEIYLGTDMSIEGTNALYDGFVQAFDETINKLCKSARN